ncbi:hypothetical protein PsorP6_012109 [Peronosclerospora sorghi]|uniref:Uncharacterized protein n=1 Tax=Peronosclerospora sorghi TaxID=230839 RepID=A0ACC0WKC4_9STRA|nr:hypothetical protein PsorP6_012109 [Peronosclerospora sorghi]
MECTTPQTIAFRHFDHTAYQQEKVRKQRDARARSSSRSRPPRPPTGYSSDSSAGGYHLRAPSEDQKHRLDQRDTGVSLKSTRECRPSNASWGLQS